MASVRVRLKSGGMRALLNDDGVRRGALHPVADRVAAAMRAGAPRETGALAESVTVWDDTTDRAAVRVGSRLHYAAAIEAGTGFMSRAVGGA